METKARKSTGLGRGLSALLGDQASDKPQGGGGVIEAPIEHVAPNPLQPRKRFDEDAIADLVASIRAQGVLQPLLVRRKATAAGDAALYEIIAGERRWRAAQAARLERVPVIVKDLSDSESLEIALIENIQREDLNAIEEALAYRRLIDEFGHTQEALAKALGKSRPHVANILRLLDLPEDVQEMVVEGALSMGHARALVVARDPSALAREAVRQGLNVRQVETRVKREGKAGQPRQTPRLDPNTSALERDLSSALGLKVAIDDRAQKGGEVKIRYRTLEQLDEICRRLCHR